MKKFANKSLAFFVILSMLASMFFIGVVAASTTTDVFDEPQLRAAVGAGGTGDTVRLMSDIPVITTELTIARSLILDLNGKTLDIIATDNYSSGIKIEPGVGLTIRDSSNPNTGVLNVTSTATKPEEGYGAGINVTEGSLSIEGGTIKAIGSGVFPSGAAGIGGGVFRDGGNITISGGTVTAIGGEGGTGIGGGSENGADVVISGGIIIATGGYGGAGIGGGYANVYSNIGVVITGSADVTAFGGVVSAGIGSSMESEVECNIFISGSAVVNATGGEPFADGVGGGAGIGGGTYLEGGDIVISGGTVNAKGGLRAAGIGSGYDAYGSGNITIEDGAVNATGGEGGAGIGGGAASDGNNITIKSGKVTAKGGDGSYKADGTATFGGGAGIGGGGGFSFILEGFGEYDQPGGSGGNITISGGIITATGGDTNVGGALRHGGAGIGGGGSGEYVPGGDCGNVIISGGIITVTGGNGGAGIGGGDGGAAGTVRITGGTVQAASDFRALSNAPEALPTSTYWHKFNISAIPGGTWVSSRTAAYTWAASHKYVEITETDPGTAPVITTASLPDSYIDAAYSQTLAASGTAPVIWSVVDGSLPLGLTLSDATGVISGKPTATGTSTFTLKAENTYGEDTKRFIITITEFALSPVITTAILPNGYVGSAYSETLDVLGSAPIRWSVVSGSLPAGLSLSGNTIQGTPTTVGISIFSVRATNSGGIDTRELSIIVTETSIAPIITNANLPDSYLNANYNQLLYATGSAPITWSIASGSLPAGLILSDDTILGTPTTVGTSTFALRATNSAGSNTKQFSITITEAAIAPVISTASLPNSNVGALYMQMLTATGSTPITWTLIGELPDGLNLSGYTISGTPTKVGTSTFSIRAENSIGSSTRQFSISISPAAFTSTPGTISNPANGASFIHSNKFVTLHAISLNGVSLTIDKSNPLKFLLGYPGFTGSIGEAVSGSTIINLYPVFLNTLPDGTHTLRVSFLEGQSPIEYSTTFVIDRTAGTTTPKSPKTGDDANTLMWSALLLVAITGIAGTLIWSLRKKTE